MSNPAQQPDFAYIPPPAVKYEIDSYYEEEGLQEKAIRKCKENPFVPLGTAFTTIVLALGLRTLKTGKTKNANLLMRLRVGGQGFTVMAMLVGIWYKAKQEHDKK